MDFHVHTGKRFKLEHCYTCALPGYLILSSTESVTGLHELCPAAQSEFSSLMSAATKAVNEVVKPIKIYCAQFGEEFGGLHFHIFPRTEALTKHYLRCFPQYEALIHGPLLFDWARDEYRMSQSEVWYSVEPVIIKISQHFLSSSIAFA